MPSINSLASPVREIWVVFLGADGRQDVVYGGPGRIQIKDYGVRIAKLDREDSITTIPWSRILKVEEVI
jgi:hypothetical protein